MPLLSFDEARVLLDQYAEGSLDPATSHDVENALQADANLATEYKQLKQTLLALRNMKRPEPPSDLVARVRSALAEQRLADNPTETGADGPPEAGAAAAAQNEWSAGQLGGVDHGAFMGSERDEDSAPKGFFSFFSSLEVQLGAGVFMAAALVLGVGLYATNPSSNVLDMNAPTDVETAGIGGTHLSIHELKVSSEVLSDIDPIHQLATAAGMTVVADAPFTFEGSALAAQKFSLALRQLADRSAGDVVGFLPQAGQVQIHLVALP